MPLWKIIFLSLSGVAILLLAWRLVRRGKGERVASPPMPNDTAAGLGTGSVSVSPPPVPAARPAAVPAVPVTAVAKTAPAASKAADAVPVIVTGQSSVPSRNGEPAYAPSAESRTHRGGIWQDRSLFHADLEPIDADNPLPRVEPDEIPLHGTADYNYGAATPVFAALLPETAARQEETKRDLKSAGYYQPHALQNLSATRYLLMMGAILFFGALVLFVPKRFEGPTLFALVTAAVAGWALPRLMVRSKATNRLFEIERGIPDMLDMLNMCVSQGLTVQDSLGRVAKQMEPVYPDLATELKIVTEQAEVGSLGQALDNFSDRIDLPEVHSFTSLINQTERMGTSISQALLTYSDTMRENLRQRADEKANRAAFRLLFPTVMFLMPAVFIFLLGPAIVELSDFFTGGGRQALGRNRQVIQDVNTRLGTPVGGRR